MKQTEKSRRLTDLILALAGVTVLAVLVGILFDYYYEFNDDVLMKDILSGCYTGTPSLYNVQMLAPVSAVITAAYRLIPGIHWYGLFLCACHYGCVLLITYRAIRISPRKRSAAIAVAVAMLFFTTLLLPHIVMAQYTVTVAVIAAAAAFVFYTIPYDLDEHRFLKQAVPAVLLVILAYNVRSEMLLLLLPYIAITGLARWNRESSMFGRDTVRRYLLVILFIAVGMGASFGIDRAAYSSSEWRTFLNEFDGRTQLYDYQYVPSYEDNREFYDSEGLTAADVELLENYDYGIDSKITGEVLEDVAEYADSLRGTSTAQRVKTALWEYAYRLIHFTDGAYEAVVFFLYVIMVCAIIARKESTARHKLSIIFIRVGGLFVMRSISWLYIIYGHRAPDRITHSLYMIETVILLAMVMVEFTSKLREKRYLQMITSVLLIGGGIVMLPLVYTELEEHIAEQGRINQTGRAIDEYCSAHPENFYFEDVYTTIIDGETFNEKMFADADDSVKNYDLIGGWICNSPVYRQKLARYGITDAAESILNSGCVYIVCADSPGTGWIDDYYADCGTAVKVERIDSITDSIGVYRVVPAD